MRVPRVYWRYTRAACSRSSGCRASQLADVDTTALSLEERRDLAYLIAETWMTMIFRHGFFHGDPHPANILVLEEAGAIGLVDFGAVGQAHRRRHVEADAALHRRGAPRTSRCCRSGSPTSGCATRRSARRSSSPSCARSTTATTARASRRSTRSRSIREAFQLIYTMNLQLPSRFLLLDRAIATLGSVGVELYPDFNVFEVARPYARGLMLERFTPERVARRARA